MIYNQIVTWTAFAILAMFIYVPTNLLSCREISIIGAYVAHIYVFYQFLQKYFEISQNIDKLCLAIEFVL